MIKATDYIRVPWLTGLILVVAIAELAGVHLSGASVLLALTLLNLRWSEAWCRVVGGTRMRTRPSEDWRAEEGWELVPVYDPVTGAPLYDEDDEPLEAWKRLERGKLVEAFTGRDWRQAATCRREGHVLDEDSLEGWDVAKACGDFRCSRCAGVVFTLDEQAVGFAPYLLDGLDGDEDPDDDPSGEAIPFRKTG